MNKNQCRTFLNKYKSTPLFQPMLNIVLVLLKLRQSTLFETGSFSQEEGREHQSICDSFDIIYTQQDDFTFPRILVTLKDGIVHEIMKLDPNTINNDAWMGIFLGFMAPGGDYGNFYKNRITCHFIETTQNITFSTEIITLGTILGEEEIRLRASRKASEINQELQKIGYKCKEKIEILIGCEERYEKLKNKDVSYVKENIAFYINDYENNYISDNKILLESTLHEQLVNVNSQNILLLSDHYGKSIMENTSFQNKYNTATTNEDIQQIAIEIRDSDNRWWIKQERNLSIEPSSIRKKNKKHTSLKKMKNTR